MTFVILLIPLTSIFFLVCYIPWTTPLTPLSLLELFALVICSALAGSMLWAHWRLWQGLDQWPVPAGRYYQQFQQLPTRERESGYYQWLAERKCGAEPWATWARQEQEVTLI